MTKSTLPIRLGFIGANHVGRVLIPAFSRDPRAVAAGITSRDPVNAAAVAKQSNIATVFDHWRQLIAAPEIDAVVIATPPAVQPEIAEAVCALGKPVFAEKPIAATMSAAAAMADAARASGQPVAVNFMFPEIATWQATRRQMETGEFGALRRVEMTWRVETYGNRHRIDSWKARSDDGGGALFNFGSQALFNLEWLAGPIDRLSVDLQRMPDDPREGDSAVAMDMHFSSGATGHLFIDTAYPGDPNHDVRFHFDDPDTQLVLRNHGSDYVNGFELGLERRGGFEIMSAGPTGSDTGSGIDGRIGATATLARRFLDAVQGGPPVRPDVEDGVRVQFLLDCARKSYDQRAWTAVPRPQTDT